MDLKKQNFDGIRGLKRNTASPSISVQPKLKHHIVPMDSIHRQKKSTAFRSAVVVSRSPAFSVPRQFKKTFKFNLLGISSRMPQLVPLALALVLAFTGGMWYALKTPKSVAEVQAPVPQVESASISAPIPLDAQVVIQAEDSKTAPAISNDILFNTPIAMLKDYLTSAAAAGQLETRKARLHEFLKSRNSPLEPQADLIAEQAHWKLILAISFAESTLGEKCFDFNCSGIGGSQIRSYKSFDNWILDFNRLLENRYKDKTLEQMCGVYVQPCNPNWLLATKQILTSLDQEGIN